MSVSNSCQSYKKDKSAKWEDKSKARDEQSQRNAKETCGNCGKSRHPRAECPARDKDYNKCGKKGHYGVIYQSQTSGASGGCNRGCSRSRGPRAKQPEEGSVRSGWVSMRQSQQNNAANSRSRSRSTYLPEIRCGRVAARRAEDNSGPMPLMEDVKIKPAKGIPFKFNVFPDTGCYQRW